MLQNIETLQAQCLVQLGRYSDIARLFEERAGRVDSSPDQWTAAARAWRTANNASAASRCYRNAIFRLGSYSEVWLEYVHLLKVTSGIDEAAGEVAYRDRHADQEPPIADTVLAQAWEIVGQSDRAITHYRSAAKRNAHDVAALAIALARQGRTQDAGCGRTCRRRTMDRQYVDSRPYGRHGGCLCGRSVSRIQRNHH
ncbi:MAG: tetratricopeptide repeat protein, partial [Fuerstiella sp.]